MRFHIIVRIPRIGERSSIPSLSPHEQGLQFRTTSSVTSRLLFASQELAFVAVEIPSLQELFRRFLPRLVKASCIIL